MPEGKETGRGAGRFPLPYAAAHLHEQPAVGRGKAHRCTGAVRALRCQYHDVYLRSRYKGSEAYFRKAAGQGSRRGIKNFPLFRLVRAKTRENT